MLNRRVTFPGLAYPVFPLSVSRATSSCIRMFPAPPFVFGRLVHLRFLLMLSSFRLVNSSVLTVTDYAFPFVFCRLVSHLVISGL